nr:MAG: replication associated protein [Smacoviridae sp.]
MEKYIMTIPRSVSKRALRIMTEMNDCKKWVIGKEVGKNGYEHWQVRIETSNDGFFDWVKQHIPTAHIEKAEHGVDESVYERKEGKYWGYSDRTEVLVQRFGRLRKPQEAIIEALESTNDREVVIWYDEGGNVGKSWLTGALWERGLAYYCPPTVDTVKGMVQWVASCYMDGGFRPYIIIDIPRSWKWSEQLYVAIESIKDGLVYDTRYHSRMINIRGVKVLVLTNTLPKLDKLSKDRWRIVELPRA